jgi:hypothetical protein
MSSTKLKAPPMPLNNDPRDNGTIVTAFRHVVATCNIGNVPSVVAELLDTGAWRFFLAGQQLHQHTSFLKFIRDPPYQGCGWDPEMVEALIQKSGDRMLLMRWRQVVTAPKHVHHDTDNVSIKPTHGNSLTYTLDRLSRERPDLLAKVESKKMSANAAAIEAGFRKKSAPYEIVQKLLPKLTVKQRRMIWEILSKEFSPQ